MKSRAVILILLLVSCSPTVFAQINDSSSAQSNAEMLNKWLLSERALASKGHADAQWTLGSFYYFGGLGIPQDYAKAAVWFRKAAEQGDSGSQYELGELYLDGQGVPQDYQQAYFWLDLAAAQRSSLLGPLPDNAPQALKSLRQSMRLKVLSAVVNDRNEAASHLTQAELLRVQQSAEKWRQSHKAR